MRRRGRWKWLGVLPFVAAGIFAYQVIAERNVSAAPHKVAARQALTAAQLEGARKWAPTELENAEAMLQVVIDQEKAQNQKYLLMRDLRPLPAAYREVELKAREVAEESRRQRSASRDLTEQMIENAERSVQQAITAATVLRREISFKVTLASAKTRLRESRAHFEDGDFRLAYGLAQQALTDSSRITQDARQLLRRYIDANEIARWRRWASETIAESKRTGASAIIVSKDDHRLTLYKGGRAIATFGIELGTAGPAPKVRSGDEATPEGQYRISKVKQGSATRYYRALLLDYPNAEDLRRLAERKKSGQVPAGASAGSLIEIHGEGGEDWNWTQGCVAMTNSDIDRLFPHVSVGTPVTIVGTTSGDGAFSRLARQIQKESVDAASSE